MNSERVTIGVVLDEHAELTLSEVCRACAVHAEAVIEMVEEGIVEPRGAEPPQWRFAGPELTRLERAVRLQRDLELNLAGVALVLDLLEEVETLRARLRAMGGF